MYPTTIPTASQLILRTRDISWKKNNTIKIQINDYTNYLGEEKEWEEKLSTIKISKKQEARLREGIKQAKKEQGQIKSISQIMSIFE